MGIVSGDGYAPEFHANTASPPVRLRVDAPTAAQRAVQAQTAAATEYAKFRAEVNASNALTAEGKASMLTEFRQHLDAQVKPHEQALDARLSDLEQKAANERAALATDPADAAAQLRAQRQWDQTRRQLDSRVAGAISATLARAIRTASDTQLAVLAEEGGPYLESRNIPASSVDQALRERVPQLAQAQDALAKARKAATIVHHNSRHLAENPNQREGLVANVEAYDPDVTT
jgi:hypothetical protein